MLVFGIILIDELLKTYKIKLSIKQYRDTSHADVYMGTIVLLARSEKVEIQYGILYPKDSNIDRI